MEKTIRTGIYALLKYKDRFVVIKKSRGPFKGLYDLPGGKIEHSEKHLISLKRELKEEVGLKENDFEIKELFGVFEDFVRHTWQGKQKDEHIIAIVYLIEIKNNNLDLNYIENGGDSEGLKLIDINSKKIPKTNVLEKVLEKFNINKNNLCIQNYL